MKTPTQQWHDSRNASAFDLDLSGPRDKTRSATRPIDRADRIVLRAAIAALFVLAIILWTSDAQAQANPPAAEDQHRIHLVVHGLSHHFAERANGRDWNEHNTGLGLRYQINSNWGAQAGAYRNSIHQTSRYLWAEYTPVHLGSISGGVFAGAVDGYKANNGGFRPAGGALLRWQPGALSITARIAPKGSADGSPVVSLEAGLRF